MNWIRFQKKRTSNLDIFINSGNLDFFGFYFNFILLLCFVFLFRATRPSPSYFFLALTRSGHFKRFKVQESIYVYTLLHNKLQ